MDFMATFQLHSYQTPLYQVLNKTNQTSPNSMWLRRLTRVSYGYLPAPSSDPVYHIVSLVLSEKSNEPKLDGRYDRRRNTKSYKRERHSTHLGANKHRLGGDETISRPHYLTVLVKTGDDSAGTRFVALRLKGKQQHDTHTHTHARTCTFTHPHARTRTHVQTHACKCTHAPTPIRTIQCLDVKRWRSCQFCSETAKTKENRRNETEEEREARLQNQRTRMSTLRSGKAKKEKKIKVLKNREF
ncbi:hypothetical protein EVAR_103129_1 [Eumeta japonica]|uniref:Uncharacterized protein n=1 Tax=Eumeta variegata TaxID=151549 RepID=A0A4C1X1H6_EUMVA|nr:hypothetical protein EVAR_103129_1 [Eumeta japonica]